MFIVCKLGKGIINGKWYVGYIEEGIVKPIKFFDNQSEAIKYALELNDTISLFIKELIKMIK